MACLGVKNVDFVISLESGWNFPKQSELKEVLAWQDGVSSFFGKSSFLAKVLNAPQINSYHLGLFLSAKILTQKWGIFDPQIGERKDFSGVGKNIRTGILKIWATFFKK